MKQKDYVLTRMVIHLLCICIKTGWGEVKTTELEYLAREMKILGIRRKYATDYIRQRFIERKAEFAVGGRKFKIVVTEV